MAAVLDHSLRLAAQIQIKLVARQNFQAEKTVDGPCPRADSTST